MLSWVQMAARRCASGRCNCSFCCLWQRQRCQLAAWRARRAHTPQRQHAQQGCHCQRCSGAQQRPPARRRQSWCRHLASLQGAPGRWRRRIACADRRQQAALAGAPRQAPRRRPPHLAVAETLLVWRLGYVRTSQPCTSRNEGQRLRGMANGVPANGHHRLCPAAGWFPEQSATYGTRYAQICPRRCSPGHQPGFTRAMLP